MQARWTLVLALLAAPAVDGRAQDTTAIRRRGPFAVVRPILEGALGGAGLATAYVGGGNSGWLLRDENAVRAALGAGVGAALAAFALSTRLPRDADRPRLRASVGVGTEAEGEFSLALRAPVHRRLALEGQLLVRNASSARSQVETRCSTILGCTTGPYVVAERREQSVAALVRGALGVPAGPTTTVVLSAGAGPMASRLDATDAVSRRRDDLLAVVGVGLEVGRVSRWTVDVEGRGPVPTWRDGGRGPELAVRVGRAFGYR